MTKQKIGLLLIAILIFLGCSLFTETEKDPENNPPIADNLTITMLEEGTYSINQNELGSDEDGDDLTYSVTSASNVDAKFEDGKLVITGRLNYFGSASVNYQVSDGNKSTNGVITAEITNVTDNPIANAGSDKTGVIDQEIPLNGSNSTHPDSPLSAIVDYQWRLLNGLSQLNNENQENSNLVSNTKGEYKVELKVTDDKGFIGKDTVKVTIQSYSLIVNVTNVFNDIGIGGLEVTLEGKSSYTDIDGRVEIEFNNQNVSGDFVIKDEDGVEIGNYFNYSDSIDVGTGLELNVEMVPNLDFDSQFYEGMFDMMTQLKGYIVGHQPGDWSEDYPILFNAKRSEIPEDYYNQAVDESIQYINDTLGWEVFQETNSDEARYVFDYSDNNSGFLPDYIYSNPSYIGNAIVYIGNRMSEDELEWLKGEIVHELFCHGLGWIYHSLDNQDVSYAPAFVPIITTNEKNAKIINLKLNAGTDLNNYLID